MDDLNYEQTVELERNVSIKNRADALYADFCRYFSVKVKDFKEFRFEVWSDSHNATYLKVDSDGFIFQCRFLHETYDVRVTPSALFGYIKSGYRGLGHFESEVSKAKKMALEKEKGAQ